MKRIILLGLLVFSVSVSFAKTPMANANFNKEDFKQAAKEEVLWAEAVRDMEHHIEFAQDLAKGNLLTPDGIGRFIHQNAGKDFPDIVQALHNHPVLKRYPLKISATVAQDTQAVENIVAFLKAPVDVPTYTYKKITFYPYKTALLPVTLVRITLPGKVYIDIDPKLRTMKAFTPVIAKETACYVKAYMNTPVEYLEYVYW